MDRKMILSCLTKKAARGKQKGIDLMDARPVGGVQEAGLGVSDGGGVGGEGQRSYTQVQINSVYQENNAKRLLLRLQLGKEMLQRSG